jgi:hypothetical protein
MFVLWATMIDGAHDKRRIQPIQAGLRVSHIRHKRFSTDVACPGRCLDLIMAFDRGEISDDFTWSLMAPAGSRDMQVIVVTDLDGARHIAIRQHI